MFSWNIHVHFSKCFEAKKSTHKTANDRINAQVFFPRAYLVLKNNFQPQYLKISNENMRKRKKLNHKLFYSALDEKRNLKICPRNRIPLVYEGDTIPLVNFERGGRRGGSPSPPRVVQQYGYIWSFQCFVGEYYFVQFLTLKAKRHYLAR